MPAETEPGVCLATWARSDPEHLIITGDGIDSVVIKVGHPLAGRPGWDMLPETGWTAFPGTQWRETDSPGVWQVAVFAQLSVLTPPLTDGGA